MVVYRCIRAGRWWAAGLRHGAVTLCPLQPGAVACASGRAAVLYWLSVSVRCMCSDFGTMHMLRRLVWVGREQRVLGYHGEYVSLDIFRALRVYVPAWTWIPS